MNDLIDRLHGVQMSLAPTAGAILQEAADALEQANARERPAFEAGLLAGAAKAPLYIDDFDIEQAWQHYRCQDDTDWKTVDDEIAAAIDASALKPPGPPDPPPGGPMPRWGDDTEQPKLPHEKKT